MGLRGTGEERDGRKRNPVYHSRAGHFGANEPLEKTALAGEFYGTRILVQRFCGPHRGPHRDCVCTVVPRDRGRADKPIRSLAIRATSQSLRAHVLNPAGPAVLRDLAGEIQTSFSVNQSMDEGSQNQLGQRIRGLPTWTLLAFPVLPRTENTLVYEPAHAHVHRNAQRKEGKQHRRSTITHEGQRDSGDGHKPYDHTYVDRDLEGQHRHDTHNDEGTREIGGRLSVLNQTHQYEKV